MTHRELIFFRLTERSHTQKELLWGAAHRLDRDERFDVINALITEGLIEIISRKVGIAAGGTAVGFKQTRYALTNAGKDLVAAEAEARRGY